MNRFRGLLTLVVLVALVGAAPARDAAPNPAWEKIKSLVGDWEGTADGHPATVSYRLVSSGTALSESLSTADGNNMVTMYHADGSVILMTHYCSENNQPRMRASGLSPDGKSIDFKFVDVTNLSSPNAPRMTELVLVFSDANHLTQRWTNQEAPGKSHTSDFQFTRKK